MKGTACQPLNAEIFSARAPKKVKPDLDDLRTSGLVTGVIS